MINPFERIAQEHANDLLIPHELDNLASPVDLHIVPPENLGYRFQDFLVKSKEDFLTVLSGVYRSVQNRELALTPQFIEDSKVILDECLTMLVDDIDGAVEDLKDFYKNRFAEILQIYNVCFNHVIRDTGIHVDLEPLYEPFTTESEEEEDHRRGIVVPHSVDHSDSDSDHGDYEEPNADRDLEDIYGFTVF
jgi:hypothetical protein